MVAYSYGYKFKRFPVGAVSTSFSCSDWSRLRTLASKAYITSGSGLHKILLNSAFLKIAALWFCIITLHVLDMGPIFQVSDLFRQLSGLLVLCLLMVYKRICAQKIGFL